MEFPLWFTGRAPRLGPDLLQHYKFSRVELNLDLSFQEKSLKQVESRC